METRIPDINGLAEGASRHPVVLLVDDEPDYLDVLEHYLGELDLVVHTADCGRRALNRVAQVSPDLIVLDVNMPDMSGFDVCRQLRLREETMLLPVIFSTGLDASEDRVLALEAGATDFFSKPFRRTEFQVRIRILSHLHAARQELEAVRLAMERERTERVSSIFKRYVAPELVEQILEEHGAEGAAVLATRRRCGAVVVFADLRGFTRTSEMLGPGLVVERVHRYGGSSINMAGDCLMAGFGVPLPQARLRWYH